MIYLHTFQEDLFHAMFSMRTWNERLSIEQKTHLSVSFVKVNVYSLEIISQ